MNTLSDNEIYMRLLSVYLTQMGIGIVLGTAFFYFHRLYERRFLGIWAWSWFAFSNYMLGMALITLQLLNGETSFARLWLNLWTQISCFLQVALLLIGTVELVRQRRMTLKTMQWIMVVTIALAVAMVLIGREGMDNAQLRYFLRYGTRTLLLGLGYGIAGWVVWINPKFTKGLGQMLLGTSFLLFSTCQLTYFASILASIAGTNFSIPGFFGVIDILLIALIAISMVIWLLEDEREKLKKAKRELDNFFYSASHDLRAPISSIQGLTNLARIEIADTKAWAYLSMIEERVKKLDDVIGDIILFSRHSRVELKIEKVNFSELVAEILGDLKFNKGADTVSFRYNEAHDSIFFSDRSVIKSVLSNLISNALKYHRTEQADPFIRIQFIKKANQVMFSVEDNGEGIAEPHLKKIFDMFYRASHQSDGTGLGLYIVKEALDKLDGKIEVQSEHGKGSTFTVILQPR